MELYCEYGYCISIHVLREEDDPRPCSAGSPCGYFYPRPPRGGRPVRADLNANRKNISIHVLREEDD